MTRRLAILLLFVTAASASLSAQKPLSASKAWVKAPAAGETSARAFVLIDNPTMYDVYVVSAQTDAAASVTFQQPAATAEGKAQAVEHLTAPAYDSLELKPDGVHMLLTALKRPLKPGDVVTLVLTTDNGLALEVSAEVREK